VMKMDEREERMRRMRMAFWIAWFAITNRFRKTYVANECGHRTKREGSTVSFGERYVIAMPLATNGHPDWCLDCIGGMAIRCGWCGRPIHVGEMVTPYLAKDGMPGYTRYHEDVGNDCRKSVVGCERIDCADSGGDYCGRWYPPGRVAHFVFRA